MRKKMMRYGSILGCALMLSPLVGLADEPQQETPSQNESQVQSEIQTQTEAQPQSETQTQNEAQPQSEEEEVIDEVVVTSTPLEKYLVTTSVITDKDIEAKGARNVADAIASVPGIDFDRGWKNTNTISIRGIKSAYTKVYVDGVLVNTLARTNASSEVDLNQFPVDNIAKIEVIKGPAPVIYGADAIGGVVLITTKDGKGFRGIKLSLAGGNNGTFNTNISVGGGNENKKIDYFISAGTETTSGYTDHADQRGHRFDAKINWHPTDDSRVTFIGGYSHMDKNMPGLFNFRDGKRISRLGGFWAGLNGWEYRDWDKTTLSLNYFKKFSDTFDMDFRIFRYTEDQDMRAHGSNFDPATGYIPDPSGNVNNRGNGYNIYRWNSSPWESTVKGFELTSNLKVGKIHTFTFGYTHHDIDFSDGGNGNNWYYPDNLVWESENNKRQSFFIQDNIVPNENLMITVGVRHDKNEVTSEDETHSTDSTNPTFNVVYKVAKDTTMRASYGRTISFPLLSQYYGRNGNPDLKPEKSSYYEIGIRHEFSKTLTADLAYFDNHIKDRIASKTDYNNGQLTNLNSTRIKGWELGLTKEFNKRMRGYANYTLLSTNTDNVSGTDIYQSQVSYVPRHHFNYGLEYMWDNGYRFNLNGRWVTQRYTDDGGIRNITNSDTRTDKTAIKNISGYHVMDVKLSKQINKTTDVYLTVYNIFDKEYEDSLFFLAPGRTYLVGVNCIF